VRGTCLRNPGANLNPRLSRREALALLTGAALAALQTSCSRAVPRTSASSAPAGPLHEASLTQVSKLIESREVSPVELTRMMLDRIAALDGHFHSYITVTASRALAAAAAAEREIVNGGYRGPLHGVPIAVKDLYCTRGVRTTGGLRVLADWVPDHDATAVARLEQAGAVLLGKLNLTEGAMAGYHRDFDIPVNPWATDRWTGGSSSGSGVATATGLCFASLGSDTGGSIRFPSAANGLVGLKPTYGRVSRYGVLPLAESMDHVGPMTRSAADAAVMLQAIAGFDPNDPSSLSAPVPDLHEDIERGVEGMRIGFDRSDTASHPDPGQVVSIEAALATLEDLGARIVEATMPAIEGSLGSVWFTLGAHEAFRAHQAHFPSRAADYGPYFREFLEVGSQVTDAAYAEASRHRAEYAERFRAVLSTVDALASPAAGIAFPVTPDLLYGHMAAFEPFLPLIGLQFAAPANLAGVPAICLPCGFSDEGLPYSIQFTGRALSEAALLRIAHAYEQATAWHTRHPSV
jgi:amidase